MRGGWSDCVVQSLQNAVTAWCYQVVVRVQMDEGRLCAAGAEGGGTAKP